MRSYELVLVLRPSLSSDQRKKVLDEVKGWLNGVKIAKTDEWGQKPLSYPIRKEVSGFYVDLHLESEEGIEPSFERRLLGAEEIIRHLLVKSLKFKVKSSKVKTSLKVDAEEKTKENKKVAKKKTTAKTKTTKKASK